MAPGLHDPRSSRAVLIGTHTYDHLTDLPAVADNLRALRTALTDPLIWGLPDEHCIVVEQPGSADDALEAVAEAAAVATDLLLVYFAGHGLLSPTDDSLDLALRGSRRDQRFRRLNYEAVRGVLRDARHIRAKAVVLDCCFAGRAIVGAMGPPVELADISHVEGTYLLAAASATEAAVAPPGEKHTAFTGELLDILANGISGADPYLDFGRIHDHLCARLAAKERPRPQQRNDGQGSRIVLARNRCAAPAAEDGGVRGPLRDLLGAQQRAASKFPYRLYGAPANALATVYVRQQTRAYVSERDRRPVELAADRRREDLLREDPRRDGARHGDPLAVNPGAGSTAGSHRLSQPLMQPAVPPPRPTFARSTSVAPLRPVDEALALHRHLLILGGPGQGKSTLTLQLAASLAAEFQPDDLESVVPLRVTAAKLADMDGPWNTRVERALTEELGPFLDGALPPGMLSCLPEDHARLLIVDGLDEITNPDQRRAFISMLGSRLQDQDVPYRLMITSRPLPQDELEFINQLALGTYTLEPFSREQLMEFAGRWFGDTESGRLQAQSFLHQIGRTGVRELSRVPLLATIAAIVFREGAAGPLPASRFRLYERYFAYLDRDQTATQFRNKEQILDELKYAHEVHVQSVSYLFAHRRELVEHLADSVVGVRDANAEPRDLLRTALAWLDRRGCRPTRLQLPQWPTLVATFLGASGLFVLQGDRLRFVHYTFAEHIAADVRARGLPADFDPDDVEWRTLLDEALDANMQAWAVIVHHSNLGESGDAVLTWFNSGGTRHQALAGTLLANGVEADEGHASLFVDHVMHRLRNELPLTERRQIIRDVAGLVQHPEMRTAINRYLRHGYRTYDMQVEVARAIGPEVPEIAGSALYAAMRDKEATGAHRAHAAGALVELMPQYFDEAVEILRGIASAQRATYVERLAAGRVLGTTDPHLVNEAARILRDVFESEHAPLEVRGEAASAFGALGTEFVDEAAAVLRGLAAVPSAPASWTAQATTWLAEFGRAYAVDAAAIVRAVAGRHDHQDQLTLAQTMTGWGPDHIPEATRIFRDVITDVDAAPTEHRTAALYLGRLGYSDEAAATLMRVAQDVWSPAAIRPLAALSASQFDPRLENEAAAVLEALTRDLDGEPATRAEAARYWARLGGAHHRQAVALLRSEMRSEARSVKHRMVFATVLGALDPAYTPEATAALTGLRDIIAAPHRILCDLALTLADFGARHTKVAASILRSVIAHPDAEPGDRVSAARCLARLGPALVTEAASTLRSIVTSSEADDVVLHDAAEALSSLAPQYVPEAAAVWAALAADRDGQQRLRHEAADRLARSGSAVAAAEGIVRLLEMVELPDVQAAVMCSIAGTMDRSAPEHLHYVLRKIRERINSPDTRLNDIAVLARGLAGLDPASTGQTADNLRRAVGTGEGTSLERRWAAFCLGGLGPQFRDEAGKLGTALMSADDVDNSMRWLVAWDIDYLAPRFRDRAINCLRAAWSDSRVPKHERVELAGSRGALSDGQSAVESAAMLWELFTAEDTPRSVRRNAGSELLNSPRHAHDVALTLREDALNERLPLLDRLRAAQALLSADHPVDREAAQLLPGLLESAVEPALRISVASVLIDASAPFTTQGVAVTREILADASAGPELHFRAASELRRAGNQHRDEAMRVFRRIAECRESPRALRVRAADAIASAGSKFESEGVALLRGLMDEANSAPVVAVVASNLSFLGPAYTSEAIGLLQGVARDATAPARTRRSAARRLAYMGSRRRAEALDVLREIIADPATPARTRRLAAEQLGMFGSACAAEAADVLFGMAEASGPRTYARRAALRAASRLGQGYARRAMARLDGLDARA